MLTVLAVGVLTVSPVSSSARITHARLSSSDAPIILVSDDAAPPAAIDTMTREQLEHEYVQLKESYPSIVLPLLVGGAGVVLVGSAVELLLLSNSSNSLVFPVALIAVGVVAIGVGVVLLILRLGQRHGIDERMEAINKRLDAMPAGTTKPGEFVPPPPPSTLYYPAPPVFTVRVASF